MLRIHAGLPRTGTTALQGQVFPALQGWAYLGKRADNPIIQGRLNPLLRMRELAQGVREGVPGALDEARTLMGTVTALFTTPPEAASFSMDQLASAWNACVKTFAAGTGLKELVYSDEALIESVSGRLCELKKSDHVPLEYLAASDFIRKCTVTVVTRDPLGFLRASYYKTAEFSVRSGRPVLSFESFVDIQQQLLQRHPPASRLFLCDGDRLETTLAQWGLNARRVRYKDLVAADDVVETLFGDAPPGHRPVRMDALPRENSTWRKEDVNAQILQAAGRRHSDVRAYAQEFPRILERAGLGHFASDEQ